MNRIVSIAQRAISLCPCYAHLCSYCLEAKELISDMGKEPTLLADMGFGFVACHECKSLVLCAQEQKCNLGANTTGQARKEKR